MKNTRVYPSRIWDALQGKADYDLNEVDQSFDPAKEGEEELFILPSELQHLAALTHLCKKEIVVHKKRLEHLVSEWSAGINCGTTDFVIDSDHHNTLTSIVESQHEVIRQSETELTLTLLVTQGLIADMIRQVKGAEITAIRRGFMVVKSINEVEPEDILKVFVVQPEPSRNVSEHISDKEEEGIPIAAGFWRGFCFWRR